MLEQTCPFCPPPKDRVFFEDALIWGIWDGFPVSEGHALIIPRRHVSNWFDLNDDERNAVLRGLDIARSEILAQYSAEGFNIGVNVGAPAGQTVWHVHAHLIPRTAGDVPEPRGGVRWVIPQRAVYPRSTASNEAHEDSVFSGSPGARVAGSAALALPYRAESLHPGVLTTGPENALRPRLAEQFRRSRNADIAVGFLRASGVRELAAHISDFIASGGRLRVLTGDYLDLTEPEALEHLLQLGLKDPSSVRIRMLETRGAVFHPKAYVFRTDDGSGAAFIGSSNLSRSALVDAVEWNYRLIASADAVGFDSALQAFERAWSDPRVRDVDVTWIRSYRARRRAPVRPDVQIEDSHRPPAPHEIQREALAALSASRAAGNTRGLVVLATGLGKTWLAAFDAHEFGAKRILFVAHREEILSQAMATFRKILPGESMGYYTGREKRDADILFASIQTLGSARHLERFAPDAFDYIVVDEFHHGAAPTYTRLIRHFQAKFFLGLTATPERADGGKLLELCDENLVYRCDLLRGVEVGRLCPFEYFGVPDGIEYKNIPWRNQRFDATALESEWATAVRARNAYEQWKTRAGSRTLAFCVSQRHADFMAKYFRNKGVPAAAVHAGDTSSPRAESLERLVDGDLKVLCAVDMFNEGVDLPAVDTVMMLRPTESRIVWMQQFGRGLRVAEGKAKLTVIDYIGNHRSFLMKPQALLGVDPTPAAVKAALRRIEAGKFVLPNGCSVTYDLEVMQILKHLASPGGASIFEDWYRDYEELEGRRPTALDAFHAGINIRALSKNFGSWLRFVVHMGGLSENQLAILNLERVGHFLRDLETEHMDKSFKMIVVLCMLDRGQLPGAIDIDDLVTDFASYAQRISRVRTETIVPLEDRRKLRAYIEKNPVHFWSKGTHFSYANRKFSSTFESPRGVTEELHELIRELATWRLHAHLAKSEKAAPGFSFEAKVSHRRDGKPIIFLPDREQITGIPRDPTLIIANGQSYRARFAEIAVNAIYPDGERENALPAVLWGWFGQRAGASGTDHRVVFRNSGGTWLMEPQRSARILESLDN